MKDCIPWSKLSLQNRRKQKGSFRSRRGLRRAAESAGSLPPLCPESLLQSTGWKSLQEVNTQIENQKYNVFKFNDMCPGMSRMPT